MRQFAAGDLTKNTGDLFEAASAAPVAITKHRKVRYVMMSKERYEALTKHASSQVPLSVAEMPEDIGALLDQGIKEYLDGR